MADTPFTKDTLEQQPHRRGQIRIEHLNPTSQCAEEEWNRIENYSDNRIAPQG